MGRIRPQDRTGPLPELAAGRAGPRPGFSFRLHLIGMLLAALLPASLAIAFAIHQEIEDYRGTVREELEASARAVALTVDAEFRARLGLASALAAMATDGDALTLDAGLRAVAARLGTGVFAYGPPPAMEPLLNSRRPPGSGPSEPGAGARDAVPRIFASGRPLVGRGWQNPGTGRWLTGAYAPVEIGDEVAAVIAVEFDLQQLSHSLADQALRRQAVAMLASPSGIVLARSDRAPERIGQALPDWVREARLEGGSGILLGPSDGGPPQIHAYARPAQAPDWLVLVSQPLRVGLDNWQHPTAPLIFGAVLALMAGAALALLLAHRCLRPVEALTARAAGIIAGHQPDLSPLPPTGVHEFALLSRSLTAAHAALLREASAARHERKLLQSVIDGTPDYVTVASLDGRILIANLATHAYFGRPPGTLTGLCGRDLLPEPVTARLRRQDEAALRAGRPVSEEYSRRRHPDRVIVVTKVPWREPVAGAVAGIITLAHDITELRRTEAELRRAEAEMERLGRRATATALASGIAHELNQPLTAATNYLRAADRLVEAGVDRPSLLREALRGAADQTLRAGEIIRRLRDFMTRRDGTAAPEPLGPVVEEGVRLALGGFDTGQLRLRVEVEPALARAPVDRVAVQQVLVNLVRNALEAMQGQPRLSLAVTATRRECGGRDWIDLRVADSGPGLPNAVLERLFEPFVSTKPEGMGVGLSICQRVAEACGGSITVATAGGGAGTAFTLSLPLAEP